MGPKDRKLECAFVNTKGPYGICYQQTALLTSLRWGVAIEYHLVHVTYELLGWHIAVTAITPIGDNHHAIDSLAEKLRQHRLRFASRRNLENWVFANPDTGKPYWPGRVQENWLVPAAEKVGIGPIGWHTFRHSHSTLLHALGVDLKVQQELLRHADIRTTMNIYTQAVPNALREANSKVVRLVIPAQVA